MTSRVGSGTGLSGHMVSCWMSVWGQGDWKKKNDSGSGHRVRMHV